MIELMFSPFTKVLLAKSGTTLDTCNFRGTTWKKAVTIKRDDKSRDLFRPVGGKLEGEDAILSRPSC